MTSDVSKKEINMSAIEKVLQARDINRPKITDYIENLFTDFFEQKGDFLGKEDASIYGGIGMFKGRSVTVLGHRKGRTAEENVKCNFGMPGPEGYRKALRIMKQAEKFNRPIITFVDTPGAYPGLEAEMYGQAQAIANNLAEMSGLTVPVISIVTGEGSSGGALGIAVANKVYMLENAIYSVLSPEGFASILWHDSTKRDEAAEVMKLTADDLYRLGVIDGIISEKDIYRSVEKQIMQALKELDLMSKDEIKKNRFEKFRYFDEEYLNNSTKARMEVV